MIRVEQGSPREPAATALLEASQALMRDLFPAEANHFLSIEELCAPNITFLIARGCSEALGCGALADKGGYGEVKSVFVAPEARGAGAGAAILAEIESQARALALGALRLETGNTLYAAHRLYERAGFAYCGPFGSYADDPLSLFMEKQLA